MAFQNRVNIFKTVQVKFYVVLTLIILLVLLFPLVTIVVPLLYLIRSCVILMGKIMRPDLGEIITAQSTNYAAEEFTKRPNFSYMLHCTLKGSCDIEAMKATMVNNIIGVRKVGGDLKSIELKQYPYKWMGFIFWKWDEQFDISNHIKYYEGEENPESKMSLHRIKEIENELLFKPFPENRSPWELIVFPNVQSDDGEDVTVHVWRIHHSLADGYAILKMLFFEFVDPLPAEHMPKANFAKRSLLHRFLFFLTFLKAPYEFVETLVESYDMNDWIISPSQSSKNWIAKYSEKIPLSLVKEAQTVCNSTVSALIIAGLTAAFRKAMLKKNGKVPNYINLGFAFPMPNHPDLLRNHATVGYVKLPVGESDPLKRLKDIENTLKKFKNSTVPYSMYYSMQFMGCLFHWVISYGLKKFSAQYTAFGTSFPGPKVKLTISGTEVVECYNFLGPMIGYIGVVVSTLTYCDYLVLRLMINEGLNMNEDEVNEMTLDFSRELDVLKIAESSIV